MLAFAREGELGGDLEALAGLQGFDLSANLILFGL